MTETRTEPDTSVHLIVSMYDDLLACMRENKPGLLMLNASATNAGNLIGMVTCEGCKRSFTYQRLAEGAP